MPAEAERIAGPALRDRWRRRGAGGGRRTRLFDGASASLEGDVARLETRVYLGSQLLRDLDVMSMAHGLEVRVPFVDHVLLDAVVAGPGAHPSLMRNKRLLHETLARPLPRDAVDRPKQGFTLPFATWMTAELQPFVRSGMAHSPTAGVDRARRARATWRAWQRGAAHWSRRGRSACSARS
jgi:asparagine synthase (glutamine-hydrolysing)